MPLDITKPIASIRFNVDDCDTPELLAQYIKDIIDDPALLLECVYSGYVKLYVEINNITVMDETTEQLLDDGTNPQESQFKWDGEDDSDDDGEED